MKKTKKISFYLLPGISLALIFGGVAMILLCKNYIIGGSVSILGSIIALLSQWSPKGNDVTDSLKTANKLFFPPAFKWIGFGMALAAVAVMLVDMSVRWAWIPAILGLGIALWCRDRHEDEFVRQVRFAAAWLTLGCILVIAPIALNILGLSLHRQYLVSMERVAFTILAFYHLMFIALKFKLRNEKN
jgi:hypothetical protein